VVGIFGSASTLSGQGALRRNVMLDLISLIGVGITVSIVASLLPGISRHAGLDPVGIAFLAAAPFMANLLGVFACQWGPRSQRGLAVFRAGGALLLVVMFLCPVPVALAALATGYWMALAFSNPVQQRLWGAMYPASERGRLVGTVQTGKSAAAGAAVLVGGILADSVGGMTVVAFAGVVGALCAIASSRIDAPIAADARRFTARESWAAFRARPGLVQVGAAQTFYGGGLIAAGPLYALVQVDRLGLSIADIGMLGILGSVAATVACFVWGTRIDGRGAIPVMRIGTFLGLLSIAIYTVAPSVAFLWVASIIAGVANASTDMGISTVISEQVPQHERGAAVAGFNALTGARGMIAPFVASIAVQAGILSLTAALAVCAVSTAVGACMYFRLSREGIARPWRSVMPQSAVLGVDRGRRLARALVVSVMTGL
jgi:MFS family permease